MDKNTTPVVIDEDEDTKVSRREADKRRTLQRRHARQMKSLMQINA